MANISYIKVCTVCQHFGKRVKGFCPVLGNYQVSNCANGCEYFCGEKYAFDYDKAMAMGERPSTFGK